MTTPSDPQVVCARCGWGMVLGTPEGAICMSCARGLTTPPISTSSPRFKLDENGAVTGPGLHIKAEHQLVPGHVMFTVEQLNQFYELGVLEGKMAESKTVKP